MKKIICIMLMVFSVFTVTINYTDIYAAENGLVPNFSDDFESYETDKWIEQTNGFDIKWSNNVLDKGESLGMDSHLYERAKIEFENGISGNKVLHLKNLEGGNSFFYIGPKGDYRYKNFTGTFKVKFGKDNDGWISLNLRKSENVWYTGCHNLNLVISAAKDNSCILLYPYRNMPGSSDQILKNTATLENDGYYMTLNSYVNPEKDYEGDWMEIKYEANDKNFKVYIDDFMLLDLYYPSRQIDNFGYVSLNGCNTNAYFDNFNITNNDIETPPILKDNNDNGYNEENKETPQPEKPNSGCRNSSSNIICLTAVLFFIKNICK